jgi:hypothetical protein
LSYIKDKGMKSISEIKEKMLQGDLAVASRMIGITAANGSKALARTDSKHHDKLIDALKKIIDMRETLINTNNF